MWFYPLLFIIGLVIGLYDSVAGSGGLALVSVLSLFNLPPQMTLGTMRLVTLVQESVSLGAFLKKGLVELKTSLILGLFAAIGSIIGTTIIFNIPEEVLALIIAVLMVILAGLIPFLNFKRQLPRPIYLIKKLYKELTDQDTTIKSVSNKKFMLLLLIFFGLGIYGGFYGAGFGTVSLIVFTYLACTNLLVGAGNSRMVGFIMSVAASTVFFTKGAVSWPHFIPLSAGTIIGSWFGVELADKFGVKYVKIALTFAVLAASIKVFLNLFI